MVVPDLDFVSKTLKKYDEPLTKALLGNMQDKVLRPHLYEVQSGICPYSKVEMGIWRMTIHHAIVSRADIMGWKDLGKRAIVLIEPMNCLLLSPEGHAYAEYNRKWCWTELEKIYGREEMVAFYNRMAAHFKTGLRRPLSYYLD